MKGTPGRIMAGFLGLSLLVVLFPLPSHGMGSTERALPPFADDVASRNGPQYAIDDPALPPPSPYISVKFKAGQEIATLRGLQQQYGASVVRRNESTHVSTVQVPSGVTPAEFARRMALDPRVEWAEPVKWRRLSDLAAAPITPNDTHYASFQKWYMDLMNVPDTWGMETGKSTVVVAVLDSGVLCTHPDLQANIWVNTKEIPGNGLDDDGNGAVDDISGFDFVGSETGKDPGTAPDLPGDSDPCFKPGDPALGNGLNDDSEGPADNGVAHGTMVAGTIAAQGNNSEGVAGMCWGCRIMPLRIANPEGWLRSNDTADAISYAARNGARIINLSLGGPDISQAERAAVDTAVNTHGALIVAAAGNENQNPIAYPARLTNVLAVGASARANTKGRASFSNWGTGTPSNRSVDVVAPGIEIASAAVVSVAEQSQSNPAGAPTYSSGNGTSFSAPLVSGLAGLILSRYPTLTGQQVRTALMSSATALPDDPADSPDAGPTWAGSGLVNALAALNLAGQSSSPTPTPTPTKTPSAASPTPTPVASGNPPQPLSPASGTVLSGLGASLSWNIPSGATQYQIQILPFNNDGPAINLIRNISTSYTVDAPVFGTGPYVMLPGMTYTWRVRTTTATVGLDESSQLWGPWSQISSFKTRPATSAGISQVVPLNSAVVTTLTPILQWLNSDQNIFYYEVQVSKDPNFGEQGPVAMVYSELRHAGATTPPSSYSVPSSFPLEAGTTYFWRVRPRIQGDGAAVAWPNSFTFKTP